MRPSVPLGAAAVAGVVLSAALLLQACETLPPRNPDDLCAIFAERVEWHRAAQRSYERWGVPEPVLLAVLHQESRFRARARPRFRRLLGFIPAGRLSSAYGYGQVKDGTWRDYQRETGSRGARRDSFEDVVDFVGWYGDVIHRLAGVPKDDAYHIYLGYHEGPGGYGRGSHEDKEWLLGVAQKVQDRADRYAAQYQRCPEPAPERRWLF